MSSKRNLFLGIILSLVIVTLMTFSLTFARYSGDGKQEGTFSGEMDYIVSNQILIGSVDEFLTAIENGYTNIKIDDDVDNPLVITGGISDVNSDLTIDLNGHELQRNNRDPLLNVTEGVRLTIIDTKGGGSFYNPVGSVLRISGGTLTVADGIFESGPRDGFGGVNDANGYRYDREYAALQNGVYTTAAGASMTSGESYEVTYYENNFSVQEQTYIQSIGTAPVILPDVSQEEGENGVLHYHVNGNMFFPAGASSPLDQEGDLYLYYTVEGDNIDNTNMAATDRSADFYYTYYATRKQETNGISYDYVGREKQENLSEEQYLVTVYGYRNVKESAASLAGTVPDFSAIQMYSGNLYVRGGRYTSYFGEDSTYCVRATGGYMAVENGRFEAVGQSVCVGIEYGQETDIDQEYLRVSEGNFYSEIGDTIQVSGGRMIVNSGTFTKDASSSDLSDLTGVNAIGANNSAIHVSGGELRMGGVQQADGKVKEIQFTLTGSNINGVEMEENDSFRIRSYASLSNLKFSINTEKRGQYTYGILTNGGELICSDTVIDLYGTYSAGLLSNGGNTTIQNGFTCNVVCTNGNTDTTSVLSSTAISTEGGSITFDDSSSAIITTDGLGITSRASSEVNSVIFINGDMSLTSSHGTAIYMSGGVLAINAQLSNGEYVARPETALEKTVNIKSAILNNPWVSPPGEVITLDEIYNGIYVEGGSLYSYGTLNVDHTGVPNETPSNSNFNLHETYQIKSYAIRVTSATTNVYDSNVTIYRGEITNSSGGGLFVGGTGSTTENTIVNLGQAGVVGQPVIRITGDGVYGFQNNGSGYAGNWQYRLPRTGGNAVEVNGGSLNIANGFYEAINLGNGIVVRSGKAEIDGGTFYGNDNYTSSGGSVAGPGASYALKVYGGTAVINGGDFGQNSSGTISQGSGVFIMGTSEINRGTAEIHGGTFKVAGQAGFSVFQYADVTFREKGKTEQIHVEGGAAAIAVESQHNTSTKITIYSGHFYASHANNSDNTDGIWYGNGNVILTIYEGTFESENIRSGLYLDANPGGNIKIYKGTFIGAVNHTVGSAWNQKRYCANGISGSYNARYSDIIHESSSVAGYYDKNENNSYDIIDRTEFINTLQDDRLINNYDVSYYKVIVS